MTNGKGKGLAKAADEPKAQVNNTDTTTASSTPVLDKISASAIGLTRTLLGAPNSNELNDSTTATLATSGKGQGQPSSSGQSSVWAESSRLSKQQPSQESQQLPKTFRNSHQDQHAASAEAQFSSFLDGIDSFEPSTDEGSRAAIEKEDSGSFAFGTRPWTHTSPHNSVDKFRTFEEQERHDGEAVLDILSSRQWEADSFPPQSIEDEMEEWRLTDEQRAKMQTLAKELFPLQEMHINRDVEDPLNLQPHQFRSKDMSIRSPEEYSQDSYLYFGQVLPQEDASRLWVEQWEDVLTRYADDVWGGLLPLVKEARDELVAIKHTTVGSDTHRPKALRRLEQVLAHFKA